MNKVLKYSNTMNIINFKDLTKDELNIVFFLFYKIQKKGYREIILTFDELLKYLPKRRNKEMWPKEIEVFLKKTLDKVQNIKISIEDSKKFAQSVIFDFFEINKNDQVLIIKVTSLGYELFNNLFKNFTKIDYEVYFSLETKYSKELYRRLKQWQSTGSLKINLEDLREILYTPTKYNFALMNNRIIKPSVEELKEHFENLEVTYYYDKNTNKKSGRPKVKSVEFTFEPTEVKVKKQKTTEKDNLLEILSAVWPDNLKRLAEALEREIVYKSTF